MKGQASAVEVGSEPDDRALALAEELHALIDRFTISAGERRQTHEGVRNSFGCWRRVPVRRGNHDGITSSTPSGRVGSSAMVGRRWHIGWPGLVRSCSL